MPRSFLEGFLLQWLDDYDDVQNAAVLLLHIQVFVGLLGTLHDQGTGVVVADVGVALFGLVAVASGYQALGRAYAAILATMLLLDSTWLALFIPELWAEVCSRDGWGPWRITAALMLFSSLVGLLLRLLSAVLWVQMFRLGWASCDLGAVSAPQFLHFRSDSERSLPLLRTTEARSPVGASCSPLHARGSSLSREFLGSAIFDPPSFAALAHPGQLHVYMHEDSRGGSNSSSCDLPPHIQEEGETQSVERKSSGWEWKQQNGTQHEGPETRESVPLLQ